MIYVFLNFSNKLNSFHCFGGVSFLVLLKYLLFFFCYNLTVILSPTSSYDLITMFLFTLSLLLFHINSKLFCFNDFKMSSDGSGRTEKKYVSLDSIKDLNTEIFPIVVSLCRFQIEMSL